MAGDIEFLERFSVPDIELPVQIGLYLSAYISLDTERSELEHIPWSAYVRYGEFYNLTRDQTEWLIDVGIRVDNVILPDRAKKARSPNGNAQRPS